MYEAPSSGIVFVGALFIGFAFIAIYIVLFGSRLSKAILYFTFVGGFIFLAAKAFQQIPQ